MKADSAMAKISGILTQRETQTALSVARAQGAAYAYAWHTVITKPDFREVCIPVRVDVTHGDVAGFQVFITRCSAASVLGREGLIGGRRPGSWA